MSRGNRPFACLARTAYPISFAEALQAIASNTGDASSESVAVAQSALLSVPLPLVRRSWRRTALALPLSALPTPTRSVIWKRFAPDLTPSNWQRRADRAGATRGTAYALCGQRLNAC